MIISKKTITLSILGFSLIATAILVIIFQNAFSTGCPTNFCRRTYTKAKIALEIGDTQEVINQLREA